MQKGRGRRLGAGGMACLFAASALAAAPHGSRHVRLQAETATPIQHVIVIVGENRSFDHLFATYVPRRRESVLNLLSQGIVRADGSPGPRFAEAQQYRLVAPPNRGKFFIGAGRSAKELYTTLPAPDLFGIGAASPHAAVLSVPGGDPGLPAHSQYLFGTGGTGLPVTLGPDTRIRNVTSLPPGPFQLTGAAMPFDAFTSDTVHQFFEMWQQMDCAIDDEHVSAHNPTGCLHDLHPAIATTYACTAADTPHDSGQGMAFFNMQQGDAPYFKYLADTYAMSDNYHQPVMGGTGPNSLVLGFADQVFYGDGSGNISRPPVSRIADPDPQSGTLNLRTHFGAWFECSDRTRPGVGAIRDYLDALPYTVDARCGPGEFYLAANVRPAFSPKGRLNSGEVVPATLQRSIGDELTARGISWKYYGGGFDAEGTGGYFDGSYCDVCNPFQYQAAYPLMVKDHIRDVQDLFADLRNGTLPAVAYVKPDALLDGHPGYSKWSLYEAFVRNVVELAQSNAGQWNETAIFVTVDESGSFYDSGFIQPVDFFGTGPRIPMIAVSPFSRGGRVTHVYAEHSSFVKFIERNWHLGKLSSRSRDNLPNPTPGGPNAYVPGNMPAIGDLFDLFNFAGVERYR
ncbi:MAG TPA: alkaline phosphatase family protein [Usitatibacter sp.]|nr:alkaline phosphatase family protein [Usitatibacter sp.]